MSTDTKAIIGTVVGTGLVVAGLLSAQISSGNASLNTRIDDVNNRIDDVNNRIDDVYGRIDDVNNRIDDVIDEMHRRMDRIEARLDRFDERLRAVEIAFGKVDQRLETLERAILPTASPPPAD